MAAYPFSLPDLEPRFLPPPDWREGTFTNVKGRTLRFGMVLPENARGIVVGLQGLSEFTEKYFETAHDMMRRGFGFCMMDWQGQGRSHRHLPQRERRYSEGFDSDIADLHEFITRHVVPAASGRPLVMLAHSMGAHIGARYIAAHPGVFSCAAFSAPMLGIYAVRALPRLVTVAITGAMNAAAPQSYAPGNGNWAQDNNYAHARQFLTSDPERSQVHETWMRHDTQLRLGGVTWAWLKTAADSCARLNRDRIMEHVGIPALFTIAGNDRVVDNTAIRALAPRAPQARIITLEDARHEILMERDDSRSRFLSSFDHLIKESLHAP